ncbi:MULTISPECIES: hypothetical protein [unclassified Paenibacillus]|uniref:hypothetical protein n=1 Tax=unclassified Paenibacillus TaxID=185978 RepID=UPI0023787B3D|nr:hypothetical protein [Paenibacillus sp. MAHUQ-63]
MEKPSYESPLEQGIECIKKVTVGNMAAEEYFSKRIDARGHYSLPWPEITWVRHNDMDLYRRFLLKLKLHHRRIVLLREEILGFTQTELYDFYGIHKDLTGKFLGRQKKRREVRVSPLMIRNITPIIKTDIDDRVISFFAILMRVPPSWILFDEPELEWTTVHFEKTGHHVVTEYELLTIIKGIESVSYHDVIPMILNIRGSKLRLRLEVKYGSFLLEYADAGLQLGAFETLVNLLEPMVKKTGIIRTVIPNHLNLAIIGGDPAHITPPEYRADLDFVKSLRVE